MKNRKLSLVVLLIFALLLIGLLSYLALVFYYKDGFSYGTWINGIYCTGKSVEEVNSELMETAQPGSLRILDRYGDVSVIELDKLASHLDYTSQLQDYLQKQNSFLWINNILTHREQSLKPLISYDEKALRQAIYASGAFERETLRSRTVSIQKGSGGYELYNGMEQVLDTELACELVMEAAQQGREELDLSTAGCYKDEVLTAQMQQTVSLWEKIEEFQQCGIVYDMGDSLVPIDPSVTAEWITLNESGDFLLDTQGRPVLNEKALSAFINTLADAYDTCGKERAFHATRGEVVKVSGGIYGNELDRKQEIAYLKQAFLEKREETHVPAYLKLAKVRGKDDIGTTYIEIDMTSQKLYYYIQGILNLETDIVTGNVAGKHTTPAGVNYVYSKQRNRVLRGPGYASPVKYWMPVKGDIGIHDASWRKEFGGEIYKTNGSHGCINLPPKVTPGLFDSLETGTPVVMFY